MRLIEDSEVCSHACELADETALAVHGGTFIPQKAVGLPLITALDGIGANLVEGDGRGPTPDGTRFWRYARGSAREARHWSFRAKRRGYFDEATCDQAIQELTEIVPMVHGLIRHRESKANVVREPTIGYGRSEGASSRFDSAWIQTRDLVTEGTEFSYSLIP